MNELPLRDIHLPEPVSWWPPAPGWWLLLILIITLTVLVPWLIKRWRRQSLNSLAQAEFKQLQRRFQQHQDSVQLAQDISALLRRVCMSYTSRSQAASLIGDDWLQQLDALSQQPLFNSDIGHQLLTAPYQASNDIDAQALLNTCRDWLKTLPRRYPA